MAERSFDGVLQLVSDRQRRQIIEQLRDGASQTTVDALVDRLIRIETLTDHQTSDRKHLAIQLYHAHLPKLADYGVLEFDPENRTVRYLGDEHLENVLDTLPHDPSVARA